MKYLKKLSKKAWWMMTGCTIVIILVISLVSFMSKGEKNLMENEGNQLANQTPISEESKTQTSNEVQDNSNSVSVETTTEFELEEEREASILEIIGLSTNIDNQNEGSNNGGNNSGGSNNEGSNNGGNNSGGSNNGGSNNGGNNNEGNSDEGNETIKPEDITVSIPGSEGQDLRVEAVENGTFSLNITLPEAFKGSFIEDKIDVSLIKVVMSTIKAKITSVDQIMVESVHFIDEKTIEVTLKTTEIMDTTAFQLVIDQQMVNGTTSDMTTLIFTVIKKEDAKPVEIPTFTNVSVHDPSVIRVDDTYYVFGSHLGVAKTDDFMNWTLINSGVKDDNPIIPNIYTELAATFEWAESDTLWASDVIQLSDGRYYMYYNACKGDSPRSATGLAISDSIEGPYQDQGIFLKSGMWGEASEDGEIYDATKHPNAVDPDVFYDKEGKLWMVYGSYSGGIFILEMDEATGLPIEGQGYGKKLLGGAHLRIEGAYMQYSPETDYYYLLLSFGGLDSTGGYNLRVGRSKTPDGEFVDASGKKLSDAKANLNFFDDAAIEPYGNKVMGNFQFTNFNGTDDFIDYGYVSSGHNSTYYDEETGQYFNIFHTRFPNRGEGHEVRVHQMFMNVDDWLVVTPHRYTGETIQSVKRGQVVGAYHFINHGNDISATIKNSQYIELKEDGTISGTVSGTWSIIDDYYAEIIIDDVVYKGVFIEQWDESQSAYVMAFTALSNQNMTIWGSRLNEVNDDVLIDNILNSMELSRTGRLYESLVLPSVANPSVKVTWYSSNETVLSSRGEVRRPEVAEGNEGVSLTVTLEKGDIQKSKTFDFTVMAKTANILDDSMTAYYDFSDDLQNATVIGAQIGESGGEVSFVPGINGNAVYLNGESGILLPEDLIQSSSYTVSMWVKPDVVTQFSPAFFGAINDTTWVSLLPQSWDTNTMVWSNNSGNWYDASAGSQISVGKWTHLAFTVEEGELIVYIDGVAAFKGQNFPDLFTTKGIFTLGVNYWDTPYQGAIDELRIYETAIEASVIEKLATSSSIDVTSGLVATYHFDQNLNDATDQVGSGLVTGERLNIPSEETLAYTAGVNGDAVVFDGTHGIKLPNDLIQSNTYSVSLWINPDDLTYYTPTFFGAMNSDSWISFHPSFRETDPYVNLWSGTAWYDGLTKTQLSVNEWTHLAFTVSEGAAKVYIDGVESFSGTNFPNIFIQEGAEFGLGVNYWDTPYKGLMDELNVYNIALSPQQIKALAHQIVEEPGEPSMPSVVTYSFDENLLEASGQLDCATVTGNQLNYESQTLMTYASGVRGSALVFDGEHGIKLPNDLIYGDTYSVSIWLNPEELTSNTAAFFGASSDVKWLALVPQSWDQSTMLWSGSEQWYDGSTGMTIPINTWSHIVFTVQEGVAKVYINGEEAFSGMNFPNLFTQKGAEFGLGVNYWDKPYKGLMDELSVCNHSLSSDEVKALFNQFHGEEVVQVMDEVAEEGKETIIETEQAVILEEIKVEVVEEVIDQEFEPIQFETEDEEIQSDNTNEMLDERPI